MRKLCVCLFYGLCVFTIVFSLFWMALPKLSLPVPDPGSEAPPSSAADLAAQAMPELAAQSYRLCDKGGRVAVYRCGTDGQPDACYRHRHLHQSSAGERCRAHQARCDRCTANGNWTCCWKIWGLSAECSIFIYFY